MHDYKGPAERGYLRMLWCVSKDKTLTSTEKHVFSIIYSIQGRGVMCTPRQSKIAELAGLSRSAVHRAILTLERRKLISVLRYKDENGFNHNSYSVPQHLAKTLKDLESHTPDP